MSYFELDTKQWDSILNQVEKFSDGSEAEKIINEYLAGEGGDTIKEGIHALLPVSGRKPWKGKRAAASSTDPFIKKPGNLSVQIKTKNGYHYLYFPDDGSDTNRHYGNKQFMFQGAGNKSGEIANQIINKLIEKLEV